MFELHDKVVYPGYGVAEITQVLEKVVAGQKTRYFELRFLSKDMVVLVPVKNDLNLAPIRALSSREKVQDALAVLTQPARKLSSYEFAASSWNKRNKEYQNKLRAGGLRELSEIYRDLSHIGEQKELSFGEKNLLMQAESLLAEEISQVESLAHEEAVKRLRTLGYTRGMRGATRASSL